MGNSLRLVGTAWLLTMVACSTNFSREVQKSVKDAYGKDFANYTFRATPVGTFGVGSMYLKEMREKPSTPVDDHWFIGYPGNWFAPGVSDQDAKALNAKIIVPGDLGSADLKKDVSTKLSLDAVVPAINQVVSGGIKTDYKRGVKVTLTATKANHHKLDITEFIQAIRDNKIKQAVKDHWNAHDFLLTAADITLTGYKASVTIDQSVNPDLYAKFNNLAGGTADAGSVKLGITKTANGSFDVAATDDVVAALLVKEPPTTVQLAAPNLDEWPAVTVRQDLLAPLDSIVATKAP